MKLNKTGFTLVELLAVIVVLAIIGLIGFTSMNAVFDSTRKSTAAANAAALKSAAKTYCHTKMMEDNGTAPTSARQTDFEKYFDGNGATATIGTTASATFADNCETVKLGTVTVGLSGKNFDCTEGEDTTTKKPNGKWTCTAK